MPLTDLAARNAKAENGKQTKKFDGGGLYLLIRPNGSKLWQMAYRYGGVTKTLSFGPYPEVSLIKARAEREKSKNILRAGKDPGVEKKLEKLRTENEQKNTFGLVADDYLAKLDKEGSADRSKAKNKWLLETLAKPIRERPINDIKPIEILSVLQHVERSGRQETAHRLRGIIGSVFRHAIATLRAETDPTFALRGALAAKVVTNRAAIIEEKPFGLLLKAIDEYDGWPTVTAALKISALCFQRPGNTRLMEWSEIDLDAAKWSIPAEKMKMRREHDVPLSRQAVAVLKDIQKFSGTSKLVFPSIRSMEKALSENAMNAALRRMGIMEQEHCAHGFRSSASTILNGRGYHEDWIEAQLAHIDTNEVRRAYNRAKYWPERVKMMQDWADLCDTLKTQKQKSILQVDQETSS